MYADFVTLNYPALLQVQGSITLMGALASQYPSVGSSVDSAKVLLASSADAVNGGFLRVFDDSVQFFTLSVEKSVDANNRTNVYVTYTLPNEQQTGFLHNLKEHWWWGVLGAVGLVVVIGIVVFVVLKKRNQRRDYVSI